MSDTPKATEGMSTFTKVFWTILTIGLIVGAVYIGYRVYDWGWVKPELKVPNELADAGFVEMNSTWEWEATPTEFSFGDPGKTTIAANLKLKEKDAFLIQSVTFKVPPPRYDEQRENYWRVHQVIKGTRLKMTEAGAKDEKYKESRNRVFTAMPPDSDVEKTSAEPKIITLTFHTDRSGLLRFVESLKTGGGGSRATGNIVGGGTKTP